MPGTPPRSTGMPGLDAQHDFVRARRHAVMAQLAARLRGEPDDVRLVLPYEEVIDALGYAGEHAAGSAVVAPMCVASGVVGAVIVASNSTNTHWDHDELTRIESMAAA